jgi:hypothetical protein
MTAKDDIDALAQENGWEVVGPTQYSYRVYRRGDRAIIVHYTTDGRVGFAEHRHQDVPTLRAGPATADKVDLVLSRFTKKDDS